MPHLDSTQDIKHKKIVTKSLLERPKTSIIKNPLTFNRPPVEVFPANKGVGVDRAAANMVLFTWAAVAPDFLALYKGAASLT